MINDWIIKTQGQEEASAKWLIKQLIKQIDIWINPSDIARDTKTPTFTNTITDTKYIHTYTYIIDRVKHNKCDRAVRDERGTERRRERER